MQFKKFGNCLYFKVCLYILCIFSEKKNQHVIVKSSKKHNFLSIFQSFKLSEEDSRLLTLYRTQAVVTEAWANCKVRFPEEQIRSVFDNNWMIIFALFLKRCLLESLC